MFLNYWLSQMWSHMTAGASVWGKTVIATVTAGNSSLKVTLTADVDQALVNRILKSISLKGNLRELGTRVLQLKATDPSGLVSNLPTKSVIFESIDTKVRR